MGATYKTEGLAELLRELQNLPMELTAEAGGIVLDTAEAAASEIRAAYPEQSKTQYGTGNLRNGVRVKVVDAGQFGAAARVASTAPHAYMYENGTAARQTGRGYNRGAMPAKHVVVPTAIRKRRGMYRELAALLERRGATVTGL
jgi:hypothetical protein